MVFYPETALARFLQKFVLSEKKWTIKQTKYYSIPSTSFEAWWKSAAQPIDGFLKYMGKSLWQTTVRELATKLNQQRE